MFSSANTGTQSLGKTVAEGCSFPLSFEGLCRPGRKATAKRGRAWLCDQSSVRFPQASSRARLHSPSHTHTLVRSILVLYLTLSFLLQSLSGPLARLSHAASVAVENKSFWRTFNRCGELLASGFPLAELRSMQISSGLAFDMRGVSSHPFSDLVPLRADRPPEHLAAFC